MPKFKVEQFEIHIQGYEVEADSEAQAIAMLFNGEAEPVDGSLEYVEVCEDRGLPADEHRELSDQLRAMGVTVDDVVIPSIRSVVRADQR